MTMKLPFHRCRLHRSQLRPQPSLGLQSRQPRNEVFVDPANSTEYLLLAMENLQAALFKTTIKISSPIALSALKFFFFRPMLDFLRKTGSYLLVNAYPFLAYEANNDVISLDYALFRQNPGEVDTGNGLRYYSLFDAVFAAMSALKSSYPPPSGSFGSELVDIQHLIHLTLISASQLHQAEITTTITNPADGTRPFILIHFTTAIFSKLGLSRRPSSSRGRIEDKTKSDSVTGSDINLI